MRDVTILIMAIEDEFGAALGSQVLHSKTLDGFGTRIENALRNNLGDDVEVEYALSDDIKRSMRSCPRCHGTERVEIEGTVAAQTLESVYSSIDFSMRATSTCPDCKGLGVELPSFGLQPMKA